MLNKEISVLINYSVENGFLPKDEANKIIKSDFNKKYNLITKVDSTHSDDILKVWKAIEDKMNFDNVLELDIFTDELASLLIGSEKYIQEKFDSFKDIDLALDWFEKLSVFTTYIKVERINKNVFIKGKKLIVTLNKSKPEKTPEQIIAASKVKNKISILSKKQVGLRGSASQNPRMAHRVIDLPFNDRWFIQYSPYQYFNKHAIVIDNNEQRMKIQKSSVEFMLDFIDNIKTFNISLNADKPIVGGSLLNHMHFQAGGYDFPLYKAKTKHIKDNLSLVDWPITTFLIEDTIKEKVVEKAISLIDLWRNYENKNYKDIYGSKHNTVSLTAKKENGKFKLYILLRNNATSEKQPRGIFHVPEEYQIIKQENIGIIEAAGFAIFPGRLDYNNIKNSSDEKFLEWKNRIGGFENKKEYQDKLIETFEKILEGCDPLKNKEVKKDFLEEVNKNV